MAEYRVFGGCLRSDFPLPELRPAETGAPADWRLEDGGPRAPEREGPLVSEEHVLGGPTIRLFQSDGGFRFVYTDTGVFDVLEHGRRIVWYPPVGAPMELGRSDVLGRVLAAALQAAGCICLHASAVATPAGAVAFLAPKFHGKSTIALALTYAGARLITDDTLAIRVGSPPLCLPGVHTIRLREESARRLVGDPPRDGLVMGDRQLVNWLPEASLATGTSPLVAVYRLAPVRGEDAEHAVRRVPVPPVQAAIAMVQHAKIQQLSRGTQAAEHFDRASALAAAVPFFRLDVVRDLDRLGEVVQQILAWHAARGSGAALCPS